jgi:hypothetical protein
LAPILLALLVVVVVVAGAVCILPCMVLCAEVSWASTELVCTGVIHICRITAGSGAPDTGTAEAAAEVEVEAGIRAIASIRRRAWASV